MQRTAAVEVDQDFELETEITKSYEENGRRVIRGVASGVLEDRDGERVSARAIAKMAAEAVGRKLPLTTRHHEDWVDEIGVVTKVEHDPENDELLIEAELPPEGDDALADKAWNRLTKHGEKLGFSIGGKLRKAFYELGDTGKRRKVLDDILLRHFALTKNQSYRQSFAEVVCKTASEADLPEPADADFFEEPDDQEQRDALQIVGKAQSPPNRSAADQVGGDRNAGVKGDDRPSQDVNGDEDGDAPTSDLPQTRHLACPNCGHEFAADLAADEPPPTKDNDTAKTAAEETTMPNAIDDTLARLRGVAAGEAEPEVAKTETETPEPEVAKTETEPSDVEKLIVASHQMAEAEVAKTSQRIDGLEQSIAKSFGLAVDAINKLAEQVAELPRGRRSVARSAAVPPSKEDVAKTRTEDGDTDAEVAKRVEDAPDAMTALKELNAHNYGITG